MHPDNSSPKPLAKKLNAFEAIEEAPFEAYARMMCDPTASVVPSEAVAFLTNWLATGAPSGAVKPIAERKSVIVGDTYVAAAAMFGDAGRLTGIFCRALTGHQPRNAVVFVNAGAIYHVGWARMHVERARELARSGIASLRFDLAGIGESRSGNRRALTLRRAQR
jgi:hypothetical protein